MARSAVTLYHNPRCGKSRAALALLRERGIEPEIVEYLKTPPTKAQLAAIVKKLGMRPEELLRKGEAVYKEKYQGRSLTGEQWLEAMAADPILIERPIAISGERAVVGRPPEKVLEIL